jgi:hypothetical protein
MTDAFFMALGFVVGWLFRRAWHEATAKDLLDAKRGRRREW